MVHRPPSFFLLVPGEWDSIKEPFRGLSQLEIPIVDLPGGELTEGSISVEMISETGGFDHLGYIPGSITDDELARSAAATLALLIEVEGSLDERRTVVSDLCRVLHENGGVAMRFEASGKSHSLDTCAHVMRDGDLDDALQMALVFSVDGDAFYSTGMHQFLRRDVEVFGIPEVGAAEWLMAFCAYLVVEDPVLANGHTFSPIVDAPIHSLERWPDHRHVPQDGRHNPLGYWRALAPGVGGLDAMDREFIFVPSLMSVITAAERNAGQPLTRSEVEDLASNANGMLVDVADARKLERGKMFGEMTAERAWEQWQIVRGWAAAP